MCREVTGHPIPAEVAARRAGDPAVLIASSAKIMRELGWDPSDSELLALAAASHSGEPQHVAVVRRLLGPLAEDDLGCPPALPMDEAEAHRVLAAGGGARRPADPEAAAAERRMRKPPTMRR